MLYAPFYSKDTIEGSVTCRHTLGVYLLAGPTDGDPFQASLAILGTTGSGTLSSRVLGVGDIGRNLSRGQGTLVEVSGQRELILVAEVVLEAGHDRSLSFVSIYLIILFLISNMENLNTSAFVMRRCLV